MGSQINWRLLASGLPFEIPSHIDLRFVNHRLRKQWSPSASSRTEACPTYHLPVPTSPSIAMYPPGYPIVRPRRLRTNPLVRDMVRETTLDVRDFILPLFVRPGTGVRQEISSMPGNYQLSVDKLIHEVEDAVEVGVRAFMLFGLPTSKAANRSSPLGDDR